MAVAITMPFTLVVSLPWAAPVVAIVFSERR
jgi:predicted membrane chloride channel (bestrophin family)